MKFKIINISFFILLFTSCSLVNNKNIAPGYLEAYRAISLLFSKEDNTLITKELIENIPYSSSTLRIGDGPLGLIILESKTSQKETWVSADGVYLVIQSGRIIQTNGLRNNLVDYIAGRNNLLLGINKNSSIEFKAYYSYDKPKLINLEINAVLRWKGTEEVELLNQTIVLRKIEEELSNDFIGWKVVNYYWIDENNFVWKSIQNISPKLPPIEIEVTKKPAE